MNLLICGVKVFCRLMAGVSFLLSMCRNLNAKNLILSPYFCRKMGETSVHVEDDITVKTKLSFGKEGGLLTCSLNTIPNPDLRSEGGGFYASFFLVLAGRMFFNGKRGRRSLQSELPRSEQLLYQTVALEGELPIFRNREHEPFASETEIGSLHLNSWQISAE